MSDYDSIPYYTIEAIDAYIHGRVPPSGFLRAVLENDLKMAFGRADGSNRAAMEAIVRYMYNKVPSVCWGSPAKVDAWLADEDIEAIRGRAHDKYTKLVCEAADQASGPALEGMVAEILNDFASELP